jgi:large subunit ribosomal protein L18
MTPTRHRPQFAQRTRRVRRRLQGTADRPRLAVFVGGRTNSVQLIDDTVGRTLTSASDQTQPQPHGTVRTAAAVGTAIGEAAAKQQIHRAVLDRRGRRYHGRVRAIAEAARTAGLTL